MIQYKLIASQLKMILDDVRCKAYAEAISRIVKPGDVVVDFGTGFGIWSMLAVKAGAARVYAIEKCLDVTRIAEGLIAENGLSKNIRLILGDAASVELPEPADYLISELMTGVGFNEYDGRALMEIRDRCLKPDGKMIPQRIRHIVRPCSFSEAFEPTQRKWLDGTWADDLYGLKWRFVLPFTSAYVRIGRFQKYDFLAPPAVWWDLDLRQDDLSNNQRRRDNRAQWHAEKDGECHGLMIYFEADLGEGLSISTAPDAPPTHWSNAFLPFARGIELRTGDTLEVSLAFETVDDFRIYPMTVVHKRVGEVQDTFDTYPSKIPLPVENKHHPVPA